MLYPWLRPGRNGGNPTDFDESEKKSVDFPWQKIPEATVLQSCDVIMNYDDK